MAPHSGVDDERRKEFHGLGQREPGNGGGRRINTQVFGVGIRKRWRDYYALTKPRVVLLMAFTAVVGMFLSQPGMVPLDVLIFGSLGIALIASAGAAVNHVVDRHIDAVMPRTRRRPLPTGAITWHRALTFAAVLAAAGSVLLIVFTNWLCLILTLASLVGYAGVYTLYLKRATTQNIVIGGAAGATPPLLGWVAVTGRVDAGAVLLFLIILIWTPPHFWALAIHRRKEYASVEIPMLPVVRGVHYTASQMLAYTIVLVLVTALPYVLGASGILYLIGALLLGARFLWFAWQIFHKNRLRLAMPMFGYSIVYLFGIFALLLVDHYRWVT